MIELTPESEIITDGEQVGELRFEENHLEKIEIYPSEQGNGYATEAIRIFTQQAVERGHSQVTTTPVTSDAIEHIFRKLGFKRVSDPSEHDFLDKGPEDRYLACFVKKLDTEQSAGG